jgi:hypothetical protein
MPNFIIHNPALLILIALALGYLIGRYRVYQLQNRGEAAVRRTITGAFSPPDYHLMNNITVPIRDGTTQIDHVLISRYGVFVVETKDYAGAIYANPTSTTWTQAFAKSTFKFQNPIFQNRAHVKAVKALLPFLPAGAVHSVVVFTGAGKFKTPRPEGVFLLGELVAYLKGFSAAVLEKELIETAVGRLECQRLALTRQTDVEHRTRLKRKFG